MVKAQLKKTVNMNTTIYRNNKTKEDNQLQSKTINTQTPF